MGIRDRIRDFKEWNVNLVNYMEVIVMRSSNNGGNGITHGHLLSPNKASSVCGGTRLHSIELLVNGVPWKSPTNLGCC